MTLLEFFPLTPRPRSNFAVTGTPDGGRNELSLKNEFTVLVSRLTPALRFRR